MIPQLMNYPQNREMKGQYTIQTNFLLNANLIVGHLYPGSTPEVAKEIEIISTKTLDKRIIDILNNQREQLIKHPQLNQIVKTINL